MSRLPSTIAAVRSSAPEIVASFGVLAVSFGAWLVTPAAGWIVLGVACILVVRFGAEAS